MPEVLEFAVRAVLIGVGATIVLDLWAQLARRAFAIPSPNWGMVGRWIGHFRQGRFVHESIAQAAPVRGEHVIGWSAHYLIGVIFAGLLLAVCGPDWARSPTLPPAVLVGVVTLAAPFLVMQPGMGAGIAASRTPNPNLSRLRSLISHTIFGVGLYLAACLAALLMRG